jgi:hypothetical protein
MNLNYLRDSKHNNHALLYKIEIELNHFYIILLNLLLGFTLSWNRNINFLKQTVEINFYFEIFVQQPLLLFTL